MHEIHVVKCMSFYEFPHRGHSMPTHQQACTPCNMIFTTQVLMKHEKHDILRGQILITMSVSKSHHAK